MERPVFEWLDSELKRVKHTTFHKIEGESDPGDRNLPPSYREFIGKFGTVKLYRRSSYWLINIYGSPRFAESPDGTRLVNFGRTDTAIAYFAATSVSAGIEPPVIEWTHGRGLRNSKLSFALWLAAKAKAARRHFTAKEWRALEISPIPFDDEELLILDARQKYSWRIVGIAPNGDIRIEVTNAGLRVLPYLSIGVHARLRSRPGEPFEGGIFLPVSGVLPGETQIIEFDCYKNIVDPLDVELIKLPQPAPDERNHYWEFRAKQDR